MNLKSYLYTILASLVTLSCMTPHVTKAEATAPLTISDTETLKNQLSNLFSAIARGEILSNHHFVLMSFSAVVYAQEGYLDESRPLTEDSYKQLLASPPLFGALLHLHRDKFAGNWSFQIREFEEELVFVKATNGSNTINLLLSQGFDVKSQAPAWLIEIDRCSYNGTAFPAMFGYTYGNPKPYLENVPVELPESVLKKVRAAIAAEAHK